MNVKQLKSKKEELSDVLHLAISIFEHNTGTKVARVSINRKQGEVVGVSFEVVI